MPGFVTASLIEGYRSVLEDRAELIEAGPSLVLVVADGAGGRPGGAQAAEFVIQQVRAAVTHIPRPGGSTGERNGRRGSAALERLRNLRALFSRSRSSAALPQENAAGLSSPTPLDRLNDSSAWSRLLSEIDARLVDDPEAGETTAVVAAVTPAGIVGASVGDSGAWVITAAGYEELTAGQRHKPCLGTGMAVPIPFSARRWTGTLLVATDGLFKYADDQHICAVAREGDLALAAERLVDLVRLRSGSLPDDVSVVLCRPDVQSRA